MSGPQPHRMATALAVAFPLSVSLAVPARALAAEPGTVPAQSSSGATPTDPNPEALKLQSVVVTGRTSATKQGALRDEIVKTESINAQEIARTGATNLTS